MSCSAAVVGGALLRKLDQRPVLRDDVGRQLCRPGELQPQRSQRIEQRLIFARDF